MIDYRLSAIDVRKNQSRMEIHQSTIVFSIHFYLFTSLFIPSINVAATDAY